MSVILYLYRYLYLNYLTKNPAASFRLTKGFMQIRVILTPSPHRTALNYKHIKSNSMSPPHSFMLQTCIERQHLALGKKEAREPGTAQILQKCLLSSPCACVLGAVTLTLLRNGWHTCPLPLPSKDIQISSKFKETSYKKHVVSLAVLHKDTL